VKKTLITEISLQELKDFLSQHHEKSFRAKQIMEWLWKKGVSSFDEMSNLSLSLRELLTQHFELNRIKIEQELKSVDGTVKFVFLLHDNCLIEGVLIPSSHRITACISSQAGCPLGCKFCATGSMGFKRNLHYSEIFDQFLLMNQKAKEYFDKNISNIVYMGMGEPLLNYDNVLKSIELLTSKEGQELSPSRITLSTVGIISEIKRLVDDGFKSGLAISLHSADEKIRKQLMPVENKNPLPALQEAIRYFSEKTGERITLEYLMLQNINDTLQDAEKLSKFCRAFPVKINIIEYNPSKYSEYKASYPDKIKQFADYLESKNMIVNLRKSKGRDIAAACGQLAAT